MKRIEGAARSVRKLLSGSKYTIDFYQREYAWHERQVRELIDDLTGKFVDSYRPDHPRHEVEEYDHYFLGSIVISHKRGQRYIVDGQQRLTTLTLLLIYLHHLQQGLDGAVDVRPLIYSEKFGRKSFNLEVPQREAVMAKLLNEPPEPGQVVDAEGMDESAQNIAERYANIGDHFPEDEVDAAALPYFADWLLENVHLVEIEAYSDEDAYTIFETMNDRGLSLSLPEMLKGYVLANVRHEDDQRKVNALWKAHMQAFRELGEEEDVDFFKNWLRARYADTIRPGRKGAENRDYERIGTEFHRWVRDQRGAFGLDAPDAFVPFVMGELDFYAKQALRIRHAARTLTPGLESIFYNDDRGFTLQTQVLLAALHPGDSPETVQNKLRVVADYLDIWIARRAWNFRTNAYSSVKYTMFVLSKELRDKSVEELRTFLRGQLEAQHETFAATPEFRLHKQNYRQVRHILARLSHWVNDRCGLPLKFEDLVSQGRKRPFEIEHIWSGHYEQFAELFDHPRDFEHGRNRIGGLLLLQRGPNQSLGDAPYEAKRDAYLAHGENLLAKSLHPKAYDNNPALKGLMRETGLPFEPHESFGLDEQRQRQELYIRLAEWVWNPSRLDAADELTPPTPVPIDWGTKIEAKAQATVADQARYASRRRFFTAFLAYLGERSSLFANVNPGTDSWIITGAGKAGVHYLVAVTVVATRVELGFGHRDKARNESRFDQLYGDRAAIEEAFGDKLSWRRQEDTKVCRVVYELELGGREDESTWPRVFEATADAVIRLHEATKDHVERLEDA